MKEIRYNRSFFPAIQIVLVVAYFKLMNGLLHFFAKALYQKVDQVGSILIFRTGSLGDSICAIPAIIAIRQAFPQAKIDILSNTGLKSLVSLKALLNPNLYNEFIDYLGLETTKLIPLLKAKKYDAVIQLPQNQAQPKTLFRDLFFFRLIIGIKKGFGWSYSTVKFWRKLQEKSIVYEQEIERLMKILAQNGIDAPTIPQFEFNIAEADATLVEKEALAIRAIRDKPFMGVVVGAKRPQNRWPIEYFKMVIDEFKAEFNMLIIGGPEDNLLLEPLLGAPEVFNLCGRFSPIQSGLMLQRCALCLSNDTGPMHLAYAFGTPVMALFSARDFPNKWFPPQQNHHKVFRTYGVHCALCLSENCQDNICMKKIDPREVTHAIRQLLNNLPLHN